MAPLRFYILSNYGTTLFLARRLQREGHTVRMHIEHGTYRFRGRGLIEQTGDTEPRRGELVLIDEDGFADRAKQWRKRGHLVFGGNALESVEVDRGAGTRMMEEAGLAIPETHSFTSFAKARKFLASPSNDDGWFFKPDDAPSYMTRNAPTAASMTRFLDFAEANLKTVKRFELQRKVDGTEVDLDVWTDGRRVVLPHEIDFEEKKLLAGELGPRTGCQSNLLWDCEDPIIDKTIGLFEGLLLDSGYVGVSALNTIVDRNGTIYGLEFSNRLGYDSTQAWMARIADRFGEQLADFLAGNLVAFETLPDRPYALTLRLSVAPYPADDVKGAAAMRGLPLDSALLDDEQFYPEDVMLNNRGELVLAGTEATVGVLAAVGPVIETLRCDLLERASHYDIPAVQYRIDPVKTAEERIDALEALDLVDRNPRTISTSIDLVDERSQVKAMLKTKTGKRSADDDSMGQSTPDSIAGTDGDLVEGGMGSGPTNDAAPASSNAGNVANP